MTCLAQCYHLEPRAYNTHRLFEAEREGDEWPELWATRQWGIAAMPAGWEHLLWRGTVCLPSPSCPSPDW